MFAKSRACSSRVIREIEIRCEPREIPDVINVDVSNLGVHDVLHVSDIQVAEGIEILDLTGDGDCNCGHS